LGKEIKENDKYDQYSGNCNVPACPGSFFFIWQVVHE
jgi:hypothetical protein